MKLQGHCRVGGAVALATAWLLVGCTTYHNVDSGEMVPKQFAVQTKRAATVCPTVHMDVSNINSDAFLAALTNSITQSGVFSSVVDASQADYLLQVSIIHLQITIIEFEVCADLRTHWRLTRRATNEVVYEGAILTGHHTTIFGNRANGNFYSAVEGGAARANIEEGLERVSRQKF
jgi:hypothetical protein